MAETLPGAARRDLRGPPPSAPRAGRAGFGRAALSRPALLGIALAASAGTPCAAVDTSAGRLEPYRIVGDAVAEPLGGRRGDAERGARVVADRETGNCLICHAIPDPEEPFQGTIGPSLAGVGRRLSEGQIRLRVIDQSRVNPATLMPPYYRIEGLRRVAPHYRGRPALSADEIEDVVAYLASLRD